jgi:hypothetical protein
VQQALAGAQRPGHLFIEADIALDRADAVIGEQHDVRMLLQQR